MVTHLNKAVARMAPADVVFAITGDVHRNSRAIKQLRVLQSLELRVTVLSLGASAENSFLNDGVHVHSLPRPSFGGLRFFWQVHHQFLRCARNVRAHVYHASDLYCLRAMCIAAGAHGGAVAYDARELYTQVASTVGRPWVRAFWRFAEQRDIGTARAVFTVSDSIAMRLSQTYGIAQPLVLHNVPEEQEARPSHTLRKRAGVDAQTTLILHQGNIQKGRGCFRLAEAMRDVSGAVLVFMGSGPLKPVLMRMVREQGWDQCVRFVDPVPPHSLLSVTADADLGVTLLEDTCLNHRYALPNKLFEYLMAGVPVLASDMPEMRRVVESFDVGQVVCSSDRAALVAGLQQCVDRADLRARWRNNMSGVLEHYNWNDAAARFSAAYRTMLA